MPDQMIGYKTCNFISVKASNWKDPEMKQILPTAQDIRIADREVVMRILGGEKELFEILMRRYNQTLYRVIRSYVKTAEQTEDLMQETYLKCYRKLEQYHADASFSTWLIRIAINEALQHIRKNRKAPFDHYSSDDPKIIQLKATPQMEPDKQYQRNELKLLIESAVDQLPEKYKVVFVLHEAEGMSHEEIANCLNLSNSNVKVRLHRAKNQLKEELFKQADGLPIYEFGNAKCDRMVAQVMAGI